jgi:hypothetical protein
MVGGHITSIDMAQEQQLIEWIRRYVPDFEGLRTGFDSGVALIALLRALRPQMKPEMSYRENPKFPAQKAEVRVAALAFAKQIGVRGDFHESVLTASANESGPHPKLIALVKAIQELASPGSDQGPGQSRNLGPAQELQRKRASSGSGPGSSVPKPTLTVKVGNQLFPVKKALLRANCRLFQERESLLEQAEYVIRAAVRSDVARAFIEMMDGGFMTIKEESRRELLALGEELGYQDNVEVDWDEVTWEDNWVEVPDGVKTETRFRRVTKTRREQRIREEKYWSKVPREGIGAALWRGMHRVGGLGAAAVGGLATVLTLGQVEATKELAEEAFEFSTQGRSSLAEDIDDCDEEQRTRTVEEWVDVSYEVDEPYEVEIPQTKRVNQPRKKTIHRRDVMPWARFKIKAMNKGEQAVISRPRE